MISLLALAAFWVEPVPARAARLKDLVAVEGVRENQLLGYGLVVGLKGTGDRQQTLFPYQTLANMLARMGLTISATTIQVKNTAAVMVTSTLPPFAQPGLQLDTTIASVGDAPNLQGGILLLTSLRGADGQVYAVAQGPVVTGGFVAGRGGTSQSVNHPTVGRGPGGATVERSAPSVIPKAIVHLQLRRADFTTASRIAEAINKRFGEPFTSGAKPENAGLVSVAIPKDYENRAAEFLAELENLMVEADRPARVVVNERTGTIVLGKDVRVSPVAILHGNLTVEIQTTLEVSQPAPLSQGTTQVVPQTTVNAREEKARNVVLPQGATVEELVRAMAAIGSTPRDVIAILQSLKAAGALDAELEVI
ncbi:MAG: flagellar basal body P-ring protein FlgI [Bryobacteraceae bacterium]